MNIKTRKEIKVNTENNNTYEHTFIHTYIRRYFIWQKEKMKNKEKATTGASRNIEDKNANKRIREEDL